MLTGLQRHPGAHSSHIATDFVKTAAETSFQAAETSPAFSLFSPVIQLFPKVAVCQFV